MDDTPTTVVPTVSTPCAAARADGAFTLGLCHDLGQGVKQDRVEAYAWYRASVAIERPRG